MRHSEETVKAGIFGIAGNVILFLIKIILFFFSGSIAILADSFHTLTDSISSLLMLAGIYKSRTPPDREHPYGHGKTEYFVMVFMAIILVFAGFMFSKEAALRIMNPIELKIDVWILTGLLFTILIKEAMSLYAFRVVRRTGSKIVQVDAWHHRFDTITSVFVLFSLIVQRFGMVRMDGIAGFVVEIVFKRNTEAGKKEEVMDMIREELVKRFGVENIEFQERPGFLPEK